MVTFADLKGKWYGVFVHQPKHGIITVEFQKKRGAIHGTWNFPRITIGAAKKGKFTATLFANWIQAYLETGPLDKIRCQLTVVQEDSQLMIVGIIPIPVKRNPFATVTLFRGEPSESAMDGICPVID